MGTRGIVKVVRFISFTKIWVPQPSLIQAFPLPKIPVKQNAFGHSLDPSASSKVFHDRATGWIEEYFIGYGFLI